MFQGCQKKIFYVKDTGSRMFSEAYFVLRDGAEHVSAGCASLAEEAEKIIRERESTHKKSRKRIGGSLLFVCGVIIGAAAVVAAVLIFL